MGSLLPHDLTLRAVVDRGRLASQTAHHLMYTDRTIIICLILLTGVVTAAARGQDSAHNPAAARPTPKIQPPSVTEEAPRDYPGIHNAVAYHQGFISGSAPEGDAGFDTLAAMGVKTIISVDGAEPDVQAATQRGLRYIHLPIGYNGFDDQRKLQLVRATRDAMKEGPVYIHCHHGKHRSAGAAAAIAVSLGWLKPGQSVDRMHVSGTAANYKGLYACASGATPMAPDEIDRVPADFPSVWKPSSFVKGMIEVDEVFEHLKAIDLAGWTTPPDHPDLVPVAEAGQLSDLFRVLIETDDVARKSPELATLMREGNFLAQTLEDSLAANEQDTSKLRAQFKLVAASCKDCHAKHRDEKVIP